MGHLITHEGIITQVSDETVTVSITPKADECNGCAVTMMCGRNEKLEIHTRHSKRYSRGQHVTIGVQVGVQRKATLLFFIVPIVVLLGSLTISTYGGMEEWASALISMGATTGWYGIMYACRLKMKTIVEVSILGNDRK